MGDEKEGQVDWGESAAPDESRVTSPVADEAAGVTSDKGEKTEAAAEAFVGETSVASVGSARGNLYASGGEEDAIAIEPAAHVDEIVTAIEEKIVTDDESVIDEEGLRARAGQDAKEGLKKKLRRKRSRRVSGGERHRGTAVFGVYPKTRAGVDKHPVSFLREVVTKRFPPAKVCTSTQTAVDGKVKEISWCIAGDKIIEARGTESRRVVIDTMLEKLERVKLAGKLAKKTAGKTGKDVHGSEPDAEQDESEKEGSRDESKTGTETGTVGKGRGSKKLRKADERPYARLMAIARELYPAVKYEVLRVTHSPRGPVILTRCCVRHVVTYGEAVGPDAKQRSKANAALAMLERLKLYSALGTPEADYHEFNAAVLEAMKLPQAVDRVRVESVKSSVSSVCDALMDIAARRDPFFKDYYANVEFAGTFQDGTALTEDFQLFFVFWHSGRLRPDVVTDGQGRAIRKLFVEGRDEFTLALTQMKFLDSRGAVLAANFEEWFSGLLITTVSSYRPPAGIKISGEEKDGMFVLTLEERDKKPCRITMRPAFAFRFVKTMPGRAVNENSFSKALGARDWFALPELEVNPRALPGENGRQRFLTSRWSFASPVLERHVLRDTKCCKPLLRVFMTLNKKFGWGVKESTMRALFMDEVLLNKAFEFWDPGDSASAMFLMLDKLATCLDHNSFPALWQAHSEPLADDEARGRAARSVHNLARRLSGDYFRLREVIDVGYDPGRRRLTPECALKKAAVITAATRRLSSKKLAGDAKPPPSSMSTATAAAAASDGLDADEKPSPYKGRRGVGVRRRRRVSAKKEGEVEDDMALKKPRVDEETASEAVAVAKRRRPRRPNVSNVVVAGGRGAIGGRRRGRLPSGPVPVRERYPTSKRGGNGKRNPLGPGGNGKRDLPPRDVALSEKVEARDQGLPQRAPRRRRGKEKVVVIGGAGDGGGGQALPERDDDLKGGGDESVVAVVEV